MLFTPLAKWRIKKLIYFLEYCLPNRPVAIIKINNMKITIWWRWEITIRLTWQKIKAISTLFNFYLETVNKVEGKITGGLTYQKNPKPRDSAIKKVWKSMKMVAIFEILWCSRKENIDEWTYRQGKEEYWKIRKWRERTRKTELYAFSEEQKHMVLERN